MDGTNRIRIFVVERFPIICFGLSRLIQESPDYELIGHAPSYGLALARIGELEPDTVIFDLELGGGSGFDFLDRLVQDHPAVRPIVLTSCEDPFIVGEAIARGASGYITKSEHSGHILKAVERASVGGVYLTEERLGRLLEELFGNIHGRQRSPVIGRLTRREQQVLRMIGRGMGIAEIAQGMGIRSSTVECHRARIRHKTGIKSASELRRFAVQWVRVHEQPTTGDPFRTGSADWREGHHADDYPFDDREEGAETAAQWSGRRS
jgi:DNA-binding NarL/FixJ family response regulator